MKNGYKILWTNHAISELKDTLKYLEDNWTEKEVANFSKELDHIIELISKNPELFQLSKGKREVRRAIVARYNNLYYRSKNDTVEILSLFSNRQDHDKIKV